MREQRFLPHAEHVRQQHVGVERGRLGLRGGAQARGRRGARAIVDRYLPRAPLERSPVLSKEFGCDLYLKIESFKPTRAFKARGALVKIASLDDAARRRGVVAASAGSHAQGVAFAAHVLGAPATVVMPH